MAMPADMLVKYRAHFNQQLLLDAENACRTLRPDLWEGYFTAVQGHSPDVDTSNYEPVSGALVAGTINDVGRNSYPLTRGQRLLRVIGVLLNVAYNTNDATTESDIATAVGLLIP